MRKLLLTLLLAAALPAAAQDTPKNLEPIPDPGPPPQAGDESLEPQVTIVKGAQETREEYRVNGKLYMVKVTPKSGVPYYLVDETGGGTLLRHDSLDTGIRPPMWVLHSW
ncbi:MAG TPA: DUF2782 domain-containing protein [Burkholderiales bacterium]|nr:DUF2782 domain-containing protein [Burkholderiales bacterium]